MSEIDTRLLAFAEEAMKDLASEVGHARVADRREELALRLAKAIEQAAEDEYGAIADELCR